MILIILALIDIMVLVVIITANMEDIIMVHEGEIKYCYIIFFFFYSLFISFIYNNQSKIKSNFYKLSEVTKIKMTKELHLAP